MSARGEDDSRPGDSRPTSRPVVSQRPTARDVPIAKFKEVSVGTSPPWGLRGPSLQPGQGAPERIVPEDIELAVLREADTLDGPHVARAARGAPERNSSPPPTPVSVEVPRVRSVPPALESQTATPTTPSARSVQSGTLMSIGSIDPRAPTELSLPSPRALSQSERAAYLGPEAVVDRTPVSALPSLPRDLGASAAQVARAPQVERRGPPNSEPSPHSSSRSVPIGSGAPQSSARRSQKADSPAPHARHFDRAPHSYSPVSTSPAPPSLEHSPGRRSRLPSEHGAPPQFEIHSELDAVPREFVEDNFDLRSVSTQREPLASRKPMESADWTPHGPVSEPRDSSSSQRQSAPSIRGSSSAITILVDPGRQSMSPSYRDSLPSADRIPPSRASVPVSWVLGAAGFALLLALLVAWVMRAPTAHEPTHPTEDRASGLAVVPAVADAPAARAAAQTAQAAPVATDNRTRPIAVAAPSSSAVVQALPTPSATRPSEMTSNPAASARPALAAPAHSADLHAPGSAAPEPSSKVRQSIY